MRKTNSVFEVHFCGVELRYDLFGLGAVEDLYKSIAQVVAF